MTWFRLLYVYQSGVKKHPSDILQGLICQTYSDIGPDFDFPNGALFGTYSEKLGMGSPYYMRVWKVLGGLPTSLPAIN
jgi:hypothetical protein